MSTTAQKSRGKEKLARIPIKIPVTQEVLPKPDPDPLPLLFLFIFEVKVDGISLIFIIILPANFYL